MRVLIGLALVSIVLCGSVAQGQYPPCLGDTYLTAVTVFPENPTSEDSLQVTFAFEFPDECWEITGAEEQSGQLVATTWRDPAAWCVQVPTPAETTLTLGPLSPGTHVITTQVIQENGTTCFYDGPTLELIVEDAAPAEQDTWTGLKSAYH